MNNESAHIYSNNLFADADIYRYLTGNRGCLYNHKNGIYCFSLSDGWLMLEDGKSNPDRIGGTTGLSFRAENLGQTLEVLRDLGGSVRKVITGAYRQIISAECFDTSGNAIRLLQETEG